MEMLGFKEDMVTQDFLYKKKNEILADPKLSDIEKTSLLWYQNLMTNIARSEFPVVSDLAGSAVGYSSDIGEAYIRRIGGQYTFDAAKRLSDPNIKTGREYLVANGIPEEAYPYFMQSLADRAKSIAGAYAKNTAPGTGNNQVEGFYAWKFDPRKWNNTDSLIENLKDMRLKNPKLFNDTMAYIVGSFIGKRPLSSVSPNKTWEGTIAGIVISVLFVSKVLGIWIPIQEKYIFLISTVAAIAGTFGDLFESKIKRLAGVKDSGTMMPGHGGFLDRFDSILFAVPFVWLVLQILF